MQRTAVLIRDFVGIVKAANSNAAAFDFFSSNFDNSLEMASTMVHIAILN